MALVLTAVMLLSGCSGRTPAGESGSSSTQTVEPETRVAAVAVPLEQTPALVPMPEERPTLYEEGASMGSVPPMARCWCRRNMRPGMTSAMTVWGSSGRTRMAR